MPSGWTSGTPRVVPAGPDPILLLRVPSSRCAMRPLFEKLSIPDGQSWTLLDRRLAEGIPFQWHYHREFELTLTLNSRGQRFVGDHVGAYDDGDLVLLGPNVPHTWASTGTLDDRAPHVALVMWFRSEWIEGLVASAPELAAVLPMLTASSRALRFSPATSAAVRPLIEDIGRLLPAKRLLRLLDILCMLAGDEAAMPLASPGAGHSTVSRENRPRVERVLDHIHVHYQERIRIDDLSDLAHLSASGLHRLFKRHTKQTISEYIAQLRIGRACQLLINTEQPIAHIAAAVGYDNLSHFNRQFRQARADTPRRFRQAFRQTIGRVVASR